MTDLLDTIPDFPQRLYQEFIYTNMTTGTVLSVQLSAGYGDFVYKITRTYDTYLPVLIRETHTTYIYLCDPYEAMANISRLRHRTNSCCRS